MQRGLQLSKLGWQELSGPLAPLWLVGFWLALGVKMLGLQFGGLISLVGLLLLSGWLPLLAAKSSQQQRTWRQLSLVWMLMVGTAIWWLPLGWGGYLATLQVSIQLPATLQNIIFNSRYEWLPIVVPIWSLGWLVSLKWLPALRQQLQRPTNWSVYWRTGWHTSWWSVVRRGRYWLVMLVGWLLIAGVLLGLVWLGELLSPLLGYGIATLGLVGLQWLIWLMLMGLWRSWWPNRSVLLVKHRWISGLLLLGLVGYAGWWLQPTVASLPAIIAHRGVNGHDGVQNTTKALKRTTSRVHPDLVEMDIQPTADHRWVVMHDPTLQALADRPGPVRDYSLSQLAGLPLHEDGQQGRLSTFHQYFQVAQQLRQPLLVEIKAIGGADQLMGPFADRYAQQLRRHRSAVHSLDYRVIARLHQRDSQLTVGYITPFYLTDFKQSVANFYSLQALTATREQVNAAHREHRQVYFWTVDRSLAMSRLTAMNADGLITNYPGKLQQLQRQADHYYFYQLINWLVSGL